MKLYFVRHGLTDSNVERRMMGMRVDEPLNEKGLQEAEHLAKKIDTDFELLYSSPLKRAYQTAEILARRLNLPVIVRQEISEIDAGCLSGMLWSEISDLTEKKLTLEVRRSIPEIDFSFYGGERIEDVRVRLKYFVDSIKKEVKGKKVLIVIHAGVLRVLYVIAAKAVPEHLGNLSIHGLEF